RRSTARHPWTSPTASSFPAEPWANRPRRSRKIGCWSTASGSSSHVLEWVEDSERWNRGLRACFLCLNMVALLPSLARALGHCSIIRSGVGGKAKSPVVTFRSVAMKKNSLTTAVVAGLAGVAGFAGLANAVDLNPDGLGQVLIYPYYTVNKSQDSLFSVVNTTGIGKAVKV